MITPLACQAYLDTLLEITSYRDYCPNGLQVAGKAEIHHIVSGVTASAALIEAAIVAKADAILVHHGYFWKGEDPRITGVKQQRIKQLLAHGINLFAYHLPLDGHAQFGNNTQLAQQLGMDIAGKIKDTGQPALALWAALDPTCSLTTITDNIQHKLQRTPQVIVGHDRPVKTIGWCTGAAQHFIEQAAAQGLDAYISGEISEQTTHLARELGIHYIAAGHHATERYGVQALGQHLAERFSLSHQFIEIANPV